jgi:hypothetical protein
LPLGIASFLSMDVELYVALILVAAQGLMELVKKHQCFLECKCRSVLQLESKSHGPLDL